MNGRKRWKLNSGILYIAPAMLIVGCLMIFPLIYTFFLSINNYDAFNGSFKFAGLDLFKKLFADRNFSLAVRNTLVWTVCSVFLQFSGGFLLAVCINQAFIKYKAVKRILLMVPWVMPGVIIALVWTWMYHSDFGIINAMLKGLGLISENINWTSGKNTALLSTIIVNAWKTIPFVMLMIEAALQSVPVELKEAAKADGVTGIKAFAIVDLPHIAPTLSTVFLLLNIWTLNSFTFIFVMTNGGPAHRSEILSMFIYQNAFKNMNFSYSSAAAVVLFLVTAIFAFTYNKYVIGGKNEQNA